MTREILHSSNRFWNTLYYEGLIEQENYQISFLRGSDRLYYNAAHILQATDSNTFELIENDFRKLRIPPAVYTDPAAPQDITKILTSRGYTHVDEETEHWYGYDLSEQKPLYGSKNGSIVSVFHPTEHEKLDQFLYINAVSNNLPNFMTAHLRSRLLKSQNNCEIYLFIAYLNGVPAATRALGIVDGIGFTAEAATLPQFRRQGLFLTLTDSIVKKAREKNCRAICVNCDATAFSNDGYKRYGYDILFSRNYYIKK